MAHRLLHVRGSRPAPNALDAVDREGSVLHALADTRNRVLQQPTGANCRLQLPRRESERHLVREERVDLIHAVQREVVLDALRLEVVAEEELAVGRRKRPDLRLVRLEEEGEDGPGAAVSTTVRAVAEGPALHVVLPDAEEGTLCREEANINQEEGVRLCW